MDFRFLGKEEGVHIWWWMKIIILNIHINFKSPYHVLDKKSDRMITVLRLGHRRERDKRITTHIGLVARAFGADEVLISTKDEGIESTIIDVTERFGGDFKIKSGIKWRKAISNWEGIKVHLTMYGEHKNDVMPKIPREQGRVHRVGSENP